MILSIKGPGRYGVKRFRKVGASGTLRARDVPMSGVSRLRRPRKMGVGAHHRGTIGLVPRVDDEVSTSRGRNSAATLVGGSYRRWRPRYCRA